ncbi:hypothetical protein GCM10020295_22020 [Streptomyces cinereospinus]
MPQGLRPRGAEAGVRGRGRRLGLPLGGGAGGWGAALRGAGGGLLWSVRVLRVPGVGLRGTPGWAAACCCAGGLREAVAALGGGGCRGCGKPYPAWASGGAGGGKP